MPEDVQEKYIALIKKHEGIIHKVISLYVDDYEDKKDLCQEILLQAWKSYGSFQEKSTFSTWLYKVSLNTVLTFKRKEKKSKEYVPEADIYDNALKNDNAEWLYYLIKQLSEVDRMLMCLHLDGYKNLEIAEITGISQNNVNVKIHRLKNLIISQFNKVKDGLI